MMAYLACNRILMQEWEDREYAMHLKKLNDLKKKGTMDLTEPTRFPHLSNNAKRNEFERLRQTEINLDAKSLQNRIGRIRRAVDMDKWNIEYEKRRLKLVVKYNSVSELEAENAKLSKRLKNAKGSYSRYKFDKEYATHVAHSKLAKKFYTPRGFGQRKVVSLETTKASGFGTHKDIDKDKLVLLNQAINQFERADVVIMKTLIGFSYKDRLKTKNEFELKFNSDLKKGLLKVTERDFEPLVNALLVDRDVIDAERIYESLYDPVDAAVIVTESLLLRDSSERESLMDMFEQKQDSKLEDDIKEKLDGELSLVLLALLQNSNLDNDTYDEERAKSEAHELREKISLSSTIFLENLRTSSRKQLKAFFGEYENLTGNDICYKMDTTKPIVKAAKTIQACVLDENEYMADKLQKYLKTNKGEFLRLFLLYDFDDLSPIMHAYKNKYGSDLESDIALNFKEEIVRMLNKRIPKKETPSENK